MLTSMSLSLLLLTIAHSGSTIFTKNIITPPSTYTGLDPSDPANVKIFHLGLKAIGVSPNGLTLESLRVKETLFVARYLAEYINNADLACTLKFSVGAFNTVRAQFLSCVRTVEQEPVVVTTTSTTSAPSTTSTTTSAPTPVTLASSTETPAPTTVPTTVINEVTVQTEETVTTEAENNKVVVDEKPVVEEIVGGGRLLEKRVPKSKNSKSSKLSTNEEPALHGAAVRTPDVIPNNQGEDVTPKKPVGAKPEQSGASGNTKPATKLDKKPISKLCFDGSLFLKDGDVWVLSQGSC